ncbi:cyclic beta-1,2-glucan synthetase [Loktanella sp. PT4BL]|jgi:cyclic beta-1,2-glucan synthetase|uniref:GH36-type glycosyl hydrolase domain-containing protein n=1 Tax=Loktanella sp. PT4BL TaxID=2135611 RepID=UPI000D75333E|nr:glucoamylase family protein [Loktanella sp. PT4BL]PXW68061.1 cyclic beta-1,2-glucan synthetase [Loktanella sp. PT4BL]
MDDFATERDVPKRLADAEPLNAAVVPGPPQKLAIYRALPTMDEWFEKVRAFCTDPPPDHARVADWILDNDYQVRRALRRLDKDLPRQFYDKLPAIAGKKEAGPPRVYVLAQALLGSLNAQITQTSMVDFIAQYQTTAPLGNAELWAIPSMLRLACLQNLVDAVAAIDPDLALHAAVYYPATVDATPVDLIAHAITNLIAVDSIKWADFVDQVSCIEAELTHDPAGVYAAMTFETRNRYRRVVDQLAWRSGKSETEVARAVVERARNEDISSSRCHVGYWLIDAGLRQLEKQLQCRTSPFVVIKRCLWRYRQSLYAAGLILLVGAAISLSVAYLWRHDATIGQWVLGLTLTFLPATIPSVWFGHWIITRLSRPDVLPEMDFSKGIAKDCATAIVIPVIIATPAEVDEIAQKIELLRIANPDPMFRFVILSDLADAQTQTLPEDDVIEAALRERIDDLNGRYKTRSSPPFVLLHRRRKYNPAEGCWMAWERKRGKIEDFNRYVLGTGNDAFDVVAGPVDVLRGIRYAITLDADTKMPPESGARLVGILAHPLNRAVVDQESGRVVAGHAILQPRIEILPKLGKGTHFTHLYAGDTAIDIYSRAVSDVYQDLFGTGIYVGKGIYDIAALHASLQSRVPDNHVLSHDLFEGLHGRAALVSNVVLYEDLPATYPDYAMRQHRWMRGDWQLLPWLGRKVPMADGKSARTDFSGLDRWKLVDNLRRSLMSPALLLFLIGGWLLMPGSALVWTGLAIAAPGSYLIGEAFAIATGGIQRGALGRAVHNIRTTFGRWFFFIAFLVSDTVIALDAILRTLWRVYVSGKNRLEWTSAAHASEKLSRDSIRQMSWTLMWPSSAIALVMAAYLLQYDPHGFWAAGPVLALWLIAPEISVWSARPRYFRAHALTAQERDFLTRVARRTWHFFETFVGPKDNWLPPDNYQFGHKEEIAHRTSPTNIGMFLVSALAARDMGFITTSDFAVRARNTLNTLGRMTTYRGHVLNWYDTQTLEPLEPRYVSTVDSGNLAVALVTLKQGCLELTEGPLIGSDSLSGLEVVLDLLCTALRDVSGRDHSALDTTERAIRSELSYAQTSPLRWKAAFAAIDRTHWHELEVLALEAIEKSPDISSEQARDITTWLERFRHDLHAIARDIDMFLPWLTVLAARPNALSTIAGQIAEQLHPSGAWEGEDVSFETFAAMLASLQAEHPETCAEAQTWLDLLRQSISEGFAQQEAMRDTLRDIATKSDQLAFGMDFAFLYDASVRLFWIGYNQSLGKMDNSHYDLLATEARLASYFAIAKHDAPVEHWFSFSRPITRLQGKPSILSWNGSMFEYLMPPLFLPSYRDTLLGESELTAVDFQRSYCHDRGVPWGISESAFGTTDTRGTFQYRAFGVPGLGIRRGLTDDLVIAPYGSALALCGWPRAAAENLDVLAQIGALTRYGFIEALDFTPERISTDRDFVAVTTFMAHHQGMIQTAIVNALQNDTMVHRFLREKTIRAMDLLLQERVPWDAPLELGRADERWDHPAETHQAPELASWVPSPDLAVPQVHLLSNGRMSSLITQGGGGGLRLNGTALTRWRPDPVRTGDGIWLYLQDAESGDLWSLGSVPIARDDVETKCVFHQHMVDLLSRHDGIVARMDVTVAPSDDVEIRRVTLTNESDVTRILDLTTFAEVTIAPPLEDERHPAFSKLFVHSAYLPEEQALLFTRRPRRPETKPPVFLHKLVSDDPEIVVTAWETERRHFLGRNRTARAPEGLLNGLSQSAGWTLDPVMSLQVRVTLKPMETRELVFLSVAAASRKEAVQTARRYPLAMIDHTFRDALMEAARKVRRLGIAAEHLPELQVLSSLVVHTHPTYRTAPPTDAGEWHGQPDLWRFGISGDYPILLLKLSDSDTAPLLDILVRGHRLWYNAGLYVDLVILRDAATSYEEPLREKVLSVISDTQATGMLGMRGGIHLLAGDQMSAQLRRGLEASAAVMLLDENKTLRQILDLAVQARDQLPLFLPEQPISEPSVSAVARPDDLQFDNGYGGFDPDNGDYLIHLAPGIRTPAPWCNILANDSFGCLVSEAGLGMSWAVNSGEHRLTPWSNDPVTDAPGEVVYLRDEANGAVWTTTPQPKGQDADCQIRHGAGFTQWTKNSHGLRQEMLCFVPVDDPVKVVRLRFANPSDQPRRMTATYYAHWLLGALGSASCPHTISRYDATLQAITGRNLWNVEFASHTAFLTATKPAHSVTGDRAVFLGREGDVTDPDGLRRWDLGGHFPQIGDACAAYQVHLEIPAHGHTDVAFVLGEVGSAAELAPMIEKWRNPETTQHAFETLQATWAKRLGAVQVRTPDPAFDLVINRWLAYQNLSCRLLARAGFYQAGGAYGFRDQLQDVLALLLTDPAKTRQQILRAAHYQFEQGDVLHWWHPPLGRGVRTRCSDDYVWLAYVTGRYIEATGDTDILDVEIPFLRAPELGPEEHDRYALFETGEVGTLLDHCMRVMDRMMVTGSHGLPLIGGGDWNDGMDRIGDKGQGESVWLAWFQIAAISVFSPVARKAGQTDAADRWQAYAAEMADALDRHGWDGGWYLRAFDDDGMPWGAAQNDECRIDLIAQAWSVLSGLPSDARAQSALRSAVGNLVDDQDRLIRLLTPPFDKTDRDPGYIRAYPPGVRENGGQYTHAAAWLGMAYAKIGDGNRAHNVFDIINPIGRTSTLRDAEHYRCEPYVLAGDVSGVGAQTGRGGWSWYTGAAGWTWQLGVSGILGIQPEPDGVRLDPCLPVSWGHVEIILESEHGRIDLTIKDPEKIGHGLTRIAVDQYAIEGQVVPYPGKGHSCQVVVTIVASPETPTHAE